MQQSKTGRKLFSTSSEVAVICLPFTEDWSVPMHLLLGLLETCGKISVSVEGI